ncbi:MAG: hypothetical protein EA408_10730 [Marinilabiliales bacterium]|nr:MAG: hypothetical protein EA408_10730 [Marinilabiliales bacterium]
MSLLKQSTKLVFRAIITALFFAGIILTGTSCKTEISDQYIDIDERAPWYWHYNGKTTLLLGGSWQDNLFNHPGGLEEHLDLIASVGGNYLRNTMSHRNEGNVFAYERDERGLFDLDRFNEEYWNRFENFLKMARERDMIVQVEVWDPWDMYEDHQSFGGWSHHPFNPANNINYTPEESGLPTAVNYPPVGHPTEHPFFRTIPELDDNALVLGYQETYFDKLLSISLRYPNILYCIHNETGELVEFGDYWAGYLRSAAEKAGVPVHVTDMRRSENVRSEDHAHIYDNPQTYSFVDISQNNAWSGLGQGHYDNIMYVRERLAAHPRPINNNKNYGAARHGEEESVARMGRIIFAGGAGARFHRPHPIEDPAMMYEKSDFGLGMSPRAQKIIKSLRMATDELDIALTAPMNELLSDREENEAYLLAEPGRQYALYFPEGGSVELDMSHASGQWTCRWINLDQAEWSGSTHVRGGRKMRLATPGEGHWIAVLLPVPVDEAREALRIKPWSEDQRYWQYKGEPVLLLGGTDQDNPFNHPNIGERGLEAHLDLLVSVGGNYIRNTMSSRDRVDPDSDLYNDNNIYPFYRDEATGMYDLDRWNETYWQQFSNLLDMTAERDIIVQIEIWDRWDYGQVWGGAYSAEAWSAHPFNPKNNINYTAEETNLHEEEYNHHLFTRDYNIFRTIPELDNSPVVLAYQEALVDRILSVTFDYDHILYCISNESTASEEWSRYWANFLHERASQNGVNIEVTEMWDAHDLTDPMHRRTFDHPDLYYFVDVSQNNIRNGQVHWDNMQSARQIVADPPRPVNNNKIYSGYRLGGGTAEGTNKFWRNILGGIASSRFHRPGPEPAFFGIGLSELAQTQIRSARMFQEVFDVFRAEPDVYSSLLSDRRENEAYLAFIPGEQYAVYFTGGGAVYLDMSDAPGNFTLQWLDIDSSRWTGTTELGGGERVRLSAPGEGHWMAVLTANI